MEPEAPAPPPEALLISTARQAVGMTATQAAAATNGAISATYWRDVERGYGGRRGKQAAARASARLLAAMAHATGVTPKELADTQREDAARVLEKILRREAGPRADSAPPPPLVPFPAAARPAKEAIAEDLLADLIDRYGDDYEDGEAVRAIGARRGADAGTRVVEILRVLKKPDLDREVLATILDRVAHLDRSDFEVIEAFGKAPKREVFRVGDIFEWLNWHPPEMRAGNGTVG
jgi:hypothetical protein